MRMALDNFYWKYESVLDELNSINVDIKKKEEEVDNQKKRRDEIISSVE